MRKWLSFSKFVTRANGIFFPLPHILSSIKISKLSSRFVYCPLGVFPQWGKNLWVGDSGGRHSDFFIPG
jgi:hypothetical protein